MHLRSLKIYCDIVDLRSFSRAAAANDVSQSAASQVVQQIEERLGVKLLDRSSRPFVLTPEGRQYYEGCRHLCRQFDELERSVRHIDDEVNGRVTVAAIYSVGFARMSRFSQEFSSRFPKAIVRVQYLHPESVYDVVAQGEAEIGLVSYPRASDRISISPWRREPMVVTVRPDHPLADQKAVSLSDLRGERFVAFERGMRIRDEIDAQFERRHVEVTTIVEFDNLETIKRAVEAGSGVSVLPAPTIEREVSLGLLIGVPIADEPFYRPLGIIHQRHRALSATADQFMRLLKEDSAGIRNGDTRGGPMLPLADFII